jgi:NAD+ kinase
MGRPRLGIIANTQKAGAAEVLRRTLDLLSQRRAPALLDEASASLMGLDAGIPITKLVAKIDLIILFGGDGTILQLARELGSQVKPIAAINIGTLGFLTLATAPEIEAVLDLLLGGSYSVSHRQMLSVTVFQRGKAVEEHYAVNEVVVTRGEISRVVHVDVTVNGHFVTRYSGDGVIVSTPTGSTAYSLSAGGPIIDPDAGVWAITPVCTHSLSSRPLVVSSGKVIELSAPPQRDRVFMSIDGQLTIPLTNKTRVEIRRAAFDLPLVGHPEANFFSILRQKLDWSGGLGSA